MKDDTPILSCGHKPDTKVDLKGGDNWASRTWLKVWECSKCGCASILLDNGKETWAKREE